MRNLVVSLMDGEEVLEEKTVEGTGGWIDRYQEACEEYVLKLMTNDRLKIRVRSTYEDGK